MSNDERAKRTPSSEAIRKLTHLNGVPISTLEARMRPVTVTGSNHGMYSYDGFLGANESLIEALCRADEIVRQSGCTHQDLANWLEMAIPTAGQRISFFIFNNMRFACQVTESQSKGQLSPFRNEQLANDPENFGWDGDYEIVNLDTGRKLNFTAPIPRWIREYGFYEGFETPYSVSPQKILELYFRTDNIIMSRAEHIESLKVRYSAQGWKRIEVGAPASISTDLDFYKALLSDNSGDLNGANKVVHIVEDNRFAVAVLTSYDASWQADLKTVFVDKDKVQKRVGGLSTFNIGEIRREVVDGALVITCFHQPGKADRYPSFMLMRERPNKAGWDFELTGSLMQADIMRQVLSYGGHTGNSEDQYYIYRNDQVEFITQDDQNSGNIFYLRKRNLRTGESDIITLSVDVIAQMLGISLTDASEGISLIKDVKVDKRGVVRGIAVVNGQAHPFQI